jgi:Leucine-rich repeat (LRR) protein
MQSSTADDVFTDVVNDMMKELHSLSLATRTIHHLLVNNIGSPVLAEIRHLTLTYLHTKELVALLPILAEMVNLTSLALPDSPLSPDHLKFLFTECPGLSKLQSLDLSASQKLMSEDLQLLSQSTTLLNLTSLNFSRCRRLAASRTPAPPESGSCFGNRPAGFAGFGSFGATPKPEAGSSGLIALLSSPVVKNLTHLNLDGSPIKDPLVQITIATSPYLSNLVSLDLSGCKLHANAITAFAASTTLVNLTHLSLSGKYLGDELFSQLFSPTSPLAKKLQSLKLEDTTITVSSLELLNKASPHLIELMLGENRRLGSDAAAFIAAHMPNLIKLDLSQCDIKDAGYISLAESTALSNLRELSLDRNGAETESVIALVNSPVMANLTHLALVHTHCGPEVLTAIAQSPAMSNLQHLNCNYNGVGDEAVIALAQSTTLTTLTWLDLGNNGIEEEGIEALCTSPVVSKLKYLDLEQSSAGNSIAAALAAPSSTLRNLTELCLAACDLNEEGVLQLLATRNLDQLDTLVLHENSIDDDLAHDVYQARFDGGN